MAVNNERAYYATRLEITNSPVGTPIQQSGGTPSRAFVTVEGSSVRYYYHGQNPTAGSGHLAVAGSGFSLDGIDNVRQLRMISTSGTAFVELTLETS